MTGMAFGANRNVPPGNQALPGAGGAYPEHAKLHAVHEFSQKIGEFVDWLHSEKGIHLAHYPWVDDESVDPDDLADGAEMPKRQLNTLHSWPGTIQDLLAEFFGIDRKQLDAETDAILAQLRK